MWENDWYKAIYHHADMFQKEAKFLRIFFVQRKSSTQSLLFRPFSTSWISAAKISVLVVRLPSGSILPGWCFSLNRFHGLSRVSSDTFFSFGRKRPAWLPKALFVTSFRPSAYCAGSLLLLGFLWSKCKQGLLSSCVGFWLQWLFSWRTGSSTGASVAGAQA